MSNCPVSRKNLRMPQLNSQIPQFPDSQFPIPDFPIPNNESEALQSQLLTWSHILAISDVEKAWSSPSMCRCNTADALGNEGYSCRNTNRSVNLRSAGSWQSVTQFNMRQFSVRQFSMSQNKVIEMARERMKEREIGASKPFRRWMGKK